MLGDGETEPGATESFCGRAIGLRERLKQSCHLLRRHPDPGVADCKRGKRGCSAQERTRCEPDRPILGELARVAEKIDDALLELGAVGVELLQCRITFDL